MQFIFNAITRNGKFLFFLLLETIALVLVFRENIYHKTFFEVASTNVNGYIDNKVEKVTSYFRLKEDNGILQNENKKLREEIITIKQQQPIPAYPKDSVNKYHQIYKVIPCRVINNSVINSHNFLTIEGGKNQGIEVGMGIVSSRGLVGLVSKTSDNYARVSSILNTSSKINARIKGKEFFGTLTWDGKDPRYLNLREIPKYVKVNKGDTIETDGKSESFPEGIYIGKIKTAVIDNTNGDLNIVVEVKEDYARLKYAYAVSHLARKEIKEVERKDTVANGQ